MNKILRNVVIFAVVTAGCGWLGYALNQWTQAPDPMQGLGTLVWLAAPLLANLLLRGLGGDGWADFGLRPNFKRGWLAYAAALLAAPLVSLVLLGVGLLAGVTAWDGSAGAGAFWALLAATFAGGVLKNIFEEFAWRGYLTPRLAALGANVWVNALATGVIWASWHIPYYLFFLTPEVLAQQTQLSAPALIAMSFVMMPVLAFTFNELRLSSGSVWPAWLLHNIYNALGFVLIAGGFARVTPGPLAALLTPGTEGVLYTALLGLVGWALYRRRAAKA